MMLTDKDKKAIVEMALTEGLKDFRAKFTKPSILDNCQTVILRDKRVLFLSLKNIDSRFTPKIAGLHLEVMTLEEIKSELEVNRRLCYLVFDRFEVTGSKVVVTLTNTLNLWSCPTCVLYIYAEGVTYEFNKAGKKWQGKYVRQFTLES